MQTELQRANARVSRLKERLVLVTKTLRMWETSVIPGAALIAQRAANRQDEVHDQLVDALVNVRRLRRAQMKAQWAQDPRNS